MQAAVLMEANKMVIRDLPVPAPGDNQILVRNKVCAICNSTDRKFYSGKHTLAKFPSIIGHEGVGIVEAAGKNINGVKPGDAVLGGKYPDGPEIASLWGQFSEYGILDKDEIVMVPEGVDLEIAACTHMLGEALNAVIVSGLKPGDNIVVIGAGAVGSSIITLAGNMFPASVIVVDLLQEKLESAIRLGADAAFNINDPELIEKIKRVTNGKPIDIIFEAVGLQNTYNTAVDLADYGSRIMAFGIVEGDLSVPFRKAYKKELQLRWCAHIGKGGNDNKRIILNMMKKNLINAEMLITSRYLLKDMEKAFSKLAQGKEIRVMINI